MKVIPITDVKVPVNRQRETFDERGLRDLMESITDKGLLHPLVVRNDGVTLVAGERRLRAILALYHSGTDGIYCGGEKLPPKSIAVVPLADLTSFQIREAELEENIRRLDLTWQEHARALAELHQLRLEQAGAEGKVHTIRETAREILGVLDTNPLELEGSDAAMRADISKAMILSPYMADPEVNGAKSQKEALGIVDRKARAKHREALLASLGVDGVKSAHSILIEDTLDFLPKWEPPELFHGIITDPPYGIESGTFGSQAAARHTYADDLEFAFRCYETVFLQASRLCRGSSYFFTFCDIRLFSSLMELAQITMPSWAVWETPLIWSKQSGMLPVPDKGPRRTYEAIIYAYRGNVKWHNTGSPDIFEIMAVANPEYGAQKPPGIYANLLSRVANPGDRILDPFAGTCPLIQAAREHHCIATCIEQNKEKVDYARVTYSI